MTRDRSTRNHDDYVRRVRQRLGSHVIVTHRPRAKAKKPSTRKAKVAPVALHRLTAGAWLRFLTLSYIARGPYRVRDISRTLGTDPTSVAQAICELKHMGLLPSQIGRTPIRRQA